MVEHLLSMYKTQSYMHYMQTQQPIFNIQIISFVVSSLVAFFYHDPVRVKHCIILSALVEKKIQDLMNGRQMLS